MSEVVIQKKDDIVMRLIHYFITEKNYTPIVVRGVKDEVWLENDEGPYRIIRINSNYIHNEEQYKMDMFKIKSVMKQIKKKTLALKMNALNIFLDVNDDVKIKEEKNIDSVVLKDIEGKDKAIEIKIPEGIQNGEKIRLIGQGKPGKNGGKNGDLYIKINIEDGKKFKLKGNDLYTIVPISPWEAALGTKAKVNSVDDTKTAIYIPNGIQSGETIEIPQKGYKNPKGERGNLIAQIKIVVPEKLTNEEKDMFKKLTEISKFNPRRV